MAFSLETRMPATSSNVFSLVMVSLYLNFMLFQKALFLLFLAMAVLYELQR